MIVFEKHSNGWTLSMNSLSVIVSCLKVNDIPVHE
jgi:hypothetical protein